MRIFVLVFPVGPGGRGWYIQQSPASVKANGRWTESPAYLGSAQQPVRTGDTFKLDAVVVRSGASYHGTPLGMLARQVRPIPDPGAITGLFGQSRIVFLRAERPGPGPPPPASAVISVMNAEAADALPGHSAVAVRLYARDAFVRDDKCPSGGRPKMWRDHSGIRQRYLSLSGFSSLRHESPEVQFMPDNSLATTARATARTVGVMAPASPVQGYEVWTFRFEDHNWLITSFIYGLCSPAGGG